MAEFSIVSRHPLAASRTGSFGATPAEGGGIRISAHPRASIIQVLGAPGSGDLAALLDGPARAQGAHVRSSGPGQWLVVAHTLDDPSAQRAAIAALEQALAGRAALVDQSHGRLPIVVEGEAIERVLAKGSPVDLRLAAFPCSASATTLLGPFSVCLTRITATRFEILVARTFAESLWHDLIDMSREYGVSAELAT